MKIILASTSPYRKEQLENFGLIFSAEAPLFDEETFVAAPKTSPRKLNQILALKKAESLASQHPNDIIIGADQLIDLKGKILGKPHTRDIAIKMLQSMSGKTHLLITSICVIYKTKVYQRTVVARIKMRKLKRDEILAYIYRDNPLNCAGSYKLEKSGLSLVKSLKVSDPSSLTGLSLMSLMKILLKLDSPIPFKNK